MNKDPRKVKEQSFLGKENSKCYGSEMGSVCCGQRTDRHHTAGGEWAKESAAGDEVKGERPDGEKLCCPTAATGLIWLMST